MKFLISKGIDVNPIDRWGSTPLNGAIKYPRIAQLLKSKGAIMGVPTNYKADKAVEMNMD